MNIIFKNYTLTLLTVILIISGCRDNKVNRFETTCDSLTESEEWQRRDLSFPGSRIVINFFDFKSTLKAAEYSNRPSLPLNVAYLSTDKNEEGTNPLTRFSRSIKDLLMIRYSDKGRDAMVQNLSLGLADNYSTQWAPHCLSFKASYGERLLKGVDFLYDENTIVRNLKLEDVPEGYNISGKYAGGIRKEREALVVSNGHIRYAIDFSNSPSDIFINDTLWQVC